MNCLPLSSGAFVCRWVGSEALYRDGQGRRVVADAEGDGWYEVRDGRVQVRTGEPEDGTGTYRGFLCVSAADGEPVEIAWGLGERIPDTWDADWVDLPWTGSGWVLEGPESMVCRARREPVTCLPYPAALGVDGAGRARVASLGKPELVYRLEITESNVWKRLGIDVQNVSDAVWLESRFADGTPASGWCVSHLNRMTLRLPFVPGETLLLYRRYDRFHGRQRARVLVNGRAIGWWYEPFEDRAHRWGASTFWLPAEDLGDGDSIELTIDPPAGAPLWNVSEFSAYRLRSR